MILIIQIVIVLIAVGFIVWGIRSITQIAEPFKTIAVVVIVVGVCLWVLAKVSGPAAHELRGLF